MSSTTTSSSATTGTNGPRSVKQIEAEIKAITGARDEATGTAKATLSRKITSLGHELTEAHSREGTTPAPAADTTAAPATADKPKKEKKPKVFQLPGRTPMPLSTSGSRFDNRVIAEASAEIKTKGPNALFELEALLQKQGFKYSLDDGGAFRRRLVHMTKTGQIDPKFAPTGVQRPPAKEEVVEAVAAKAKATSAKKANGNGKAAPKATAKPAA